MDGVDFSALHVVRVRGFTDGNGLDLARLEAAGLVRHRATGRREGWLVTAEGLQAHDTALAERRTPQLTVAVEAAYARFLALNQAFKDLCTDWQTLGAPGAGARAAFVTELHEICTGAAGAAHACASQAPWFGNYPQRLSGAVAAFSQGDDGYLTSPLVDSVHTVWSELHEDFLVTLGRERTEADGA